MVGNIPNFSRIDVLRCFLRFNKNIGREKLANQLELGEGTTRTVLKTLKSKKFLYSTKKGHILSKKGAEMLKQIYQYINMPKNITMQNIYPHFKKVGIMVKNAQKLKGLYKFRDIAVKQGAEGALILKFENKLYAPESNYKQDYTELERYFELKNGDVLVIAFSNEKIYAERGALAIAIELNNSLKKIINEF